MALRVPVDFSPLSLLRQVHNRFDQRSADAGATYRRQHEQIVEITDRACIPGMWMREKMHQPDQVTGIALGHAALNIVRRIQDALPQQVRDFILKA